MTITADAQALSGNQPAGTDTTPADATSSPADPRAVQASDTVVVARRRDVSNRVVEFTLRRPDGGRLPDWSPGSHVDVILDDGTTRQYSLCGDRWNAHEYTIAIQREPDGQGGSVAIHDTVHEGSTLRFGGPRNNFRLAPATRYLFIAGGIGITPMVPMIVHAEQMGADWHLVYLGRTRDGLAYRDLAEAYPDRVTVHCSDELGRADLDAWRPDDPAVRVMACGPERLLDAVDAWGALPGGYPPRVERFAATGDDAHRAAAPFEVVASRSGRATLVATDETITTALRRVGVDVLTSCNQGVCGTCETDVLEGTPDHRDSLLDDDERAAGTFMFPCVSRAACDRLVLDL